MYKKALDPLLDGVALRAAGEFPPLHEVDAVADGFVLGVAAGANDVDFEGCLIAGGPCIDHCEGDVNGVVIQLLVDILHPLVAAKRLRRPCVVYLATLEEAFTRVDTSPEAEIRWRLVAAAIREFIQRLADLLDVPQVCILETGEPRVRAVTAKYVEEYRIHLGGEQLQGLYALGSNRRRSEASTSRLESYRYTVVAYLPRVLHELAPFGFTDVVVTENLQEIRAVHLARSLNERTSSHGREGRDAQLVHVVTVPSPSISGTSRMYRAPRRSKIYLLDDDAALRAKLGQASAESAHYWQWIWPRELRGQGPGNDPQETAIAGLAAARELFKVSISELRGTHHAG